MNATLRIAGLLVGFVCLLLLAVIGVLSLSPETYVSPTNGVIGGEVADDPAPEGQRLALMRRAELQRWREDSGPAPGEPAPAASPAPSPLTTLPDRGPKVFSAPPDQLLGEWLQGARTHKELLRDPDYVQGVSSLPGPTADVFEQPQGRLWRTARNDQITYGGGFYIFGVVGLLAFFLAWRGRVEVKDGFSGIRVKRFNAFERANHWMTATSFVLLALTGVVILYGTSLIRPWLGPDLFDELAEGSAWLHMGLLVPFTLGLVTMILLWVWQNFLTGVDFRWLREGGGIVSDSEPPPAPRFNAGEKIVFWLIVFGGGTLVATGVVMMFPFLLFGYEGMQLVQALHAVAALAMIGVIIGHIYIGSVGMEGAFDAMWTGYVDRNWAREHHSIWYRKLLERGRVPGEPAE